MKNVYVMLSASARVETTTIRIKDVAQIICDSEEETKITILYEIKCPLLLCIKVYIVIVHFHSFIKVNE